jgi:quinoprotein dehydrogenase-associated probable ABC transporter substrate-binding protein
MKRMRAGPGLSALLALGTIALLAGPAPARAALRICADPGNLPLSNNKGEGFENKIAAVLASALGTTVENYFRPGIERGLTRTTLDADQCDVMIDMPLDSEDVVTTGALYRTTYVLAYRTERHYDFKSLDDPRLRKLKIGVYETSAIRAALAEHGIGNVQIHYLSHNADLVGQNQPSYQVQQVIDGQLDVAAVWGPMAGYLKAVKHEPITLQPANTLDNTTRLEFDMAIAARRNDKELAQRLDSAMRQQKDAIHAILTEYGVPLVQCDGCVISGELPTHGPYQPVAPQPAKSAAATVSIAQLNDWLAHGADLTTELNNAVVANDQPRVAYLLQKKHASISAIDNQGETPLHHAVIMASPQMVEFLIAHGADVNQRDRDGWTPIMSAAYLDKAEEVRILAAHGADLNAQSVQNITALGVATQYGKSDAALALLELGADTSKPVGEGGYTPLMLATANHDQALVQALLKKGANVNARNSGGVTALMIAAANSRADMVELLVHAGANVNAQTERGDTALSIAREKGDPNVIKLLGEPPAHPGA